MKLLHSNFTRLESSHTDRIKIRRYVKLWLVQVAVLGAWESCVRDVVYDNN